MSKASSLRENERIRVAAALATLAVLAAVMVALRACDVASSQAKSIASLPGLFASSRSMQHIEPVQQALFSFDGFEVVGFSDDPLVIGLATERDGKWAEGRIADLLEANGWVRSESPSDGLMSFMKPSTVLWDGKEVSAAFVIVGPTETGGSSVLVELL